MATAMCPKCKKVDWALDYEYSLGSHTPLIIHRRCKLCGYQDQLEGADAITEKLPVSAGGE
jgi:hypothetical protein